MMLLHEVCRQTGLTRKAIEYNTMQGFISPRELPNGYRDYSTNDAEVLKQVTVLRQLNLSTAEIRTILADPSRNALQTAALRQKLFAKRDEARRALLQRLGAGATYAEINTELVALSRQDTITNKLLQAFPGFYGYFVCLHFAPFFETPLVTIEQREAYETVLDFLDHVPDITLPQPLIEEFEVGVWNIGVSQFDQMQREIQTAIADLDAYWLNKREMLTDYLAFRQSQAYRDSPAGQLMTAFRTFNKTSGYNDVFIPAMKRLSPSYAAYMRQLEQANDKLLALCPEAARLVEED